MTGQARSVGSWLRARPRAVATLAIVVLGVLLPFWVNEYWLSTLVFILIAAIGALGIDVLTGRTGQISIGHACFLLVGAYTAGAIGANLGLTAALWIPLAGVVCGLLGGIVAPLASRLRGLYLAIVTIGLVYIAQHVANNISAFGGSAGRSIPAPTFGSLKFANGLSIGSLFINENGCYYYLAFILLALGMLYVRNLGRSRIGRNMAAVRDRELAAAVLGVNVARTKTIAFIVSSAMAGVAGAMYGSFLGFVTPSQFDVLLSIQYVIMIVVGGMATLWGPLLGAVFVIGLPALLQDDAGSLPFLAGGTRTSGIPVTDASAIVYGLLLVIFLLVEPRGLMGLAYRAGAFARRLRARRVPTTNPTTVNSLTQEG